MDTSWLVSLLPLLKGLEFGILALLVVLGLAVPVVFWGRMRSMSLAAGDSATWETRIQSAFEEDDAGLKSAPAGDTLPAMLVKIAVENARLCPEALEKLLEVQEGREKQRLEKGVSFLGTVGANAPFLGLTGTVLGILAAFQQMAIEGGKGGPEVMAAISGALVATAAGLMVAIPAVVAFNILKNKLKVLLEDSGKIRSLLVARSLQATVREVF